MGWELNLRQEFQCDSMDEEISSRPFHNFWLHLVELRKRRVMVDGGGKRMNRGGRRQRYSRTNIEEPFLCTLLMNRNDLEKDNQTRRIEENRLLYRMFFTMEVEGRNESDFLCFPSLLSETVHSGMPHIFLFIFIGFYIFHTANLTPYNLPTTRDHEERWNGELENHVWHIQEKRV